jgi:hypothetical protein
METKELPMSRIRFSQSIITKAILEIPFDIQKYDQMGYIRVVEYPEGHLTAYDSLRLCWARTEASLKFNVMKAQDSCRVANMAMMYWEFEDENGVKILHEAAVRAVNNRAWMALRCAMQGLNFGLEGESNVPECDGFPKKFSQKYRKHPYEGTFPLNPKSSRSFDEGLKDAVNRGLDIYVGLVDVQIIYLNTNWHAFLKDQDGDFDNPFEAIIYHTYDDTAIIQDDCDEEDWASEELF